MSPEETFITRVRECLNVLYVTSTEKVRLIQEALQKYTDEKLSSEEE